MTAYNEKENLNKLHNKCDTNFRWEIWLSQKKKIIPVKLWHLNLSTKNLPSAEDASILLFT